MSVRCKSIIILLLFLFDECGMIFPFDCPAVLSDVIRETAGLEIVCRQRDRAERLSVRRLINQHGAEATPGLWSRLSVRHTRVALRGRSDTGMPVDVSDPDPLQCPRERLPAAAMGRKATVTGRLSAAGPFRPMPPTPNNQRPERQECPKELMYLASRRGFEPLLPP